MVHPEIGARLLALCSEGSMCYDVITGMSSWTIDLLLGPLFFMLKLIFIEIPRYVNILP